MTIGRRVSVGFALIIGVLVAVSVTNWYFEKGVQREVDFVDHSVIPANIAAAALLAEMDEFRLNARVFGVTGKAADIVVKGVPAADVADYCESLIRDRGGVGRYPGFTHIDVRGSLARWRG